MGSLTELWVPTLVLSHVIGVALWFYAVVRLAGRRSPGPKPARQSQGRPDLSDQDGEAGKAARGNEVVELSKVAEEDLDDEDEATASEDGRDTDLEAEPDVKPAKSRRRIIHPLPVELTWVDVQFSVKLGNASKGKEGSKRQILYPCTGRFQAGEAAAIMGPSGAGKSTLIDILTGRKKSSGGKGVVQMNGHKIHPMITRKYMAYVGQEDVFLPNITAWESFTFYARLSLPSDISRAAMHQRMDTIMETMGIEKVKHSMVGGYMPGGVIVRGLSGGERRRLSVACGLVGNPSVMFLDEPTTGLDSHAALAMVKHLVSLTRLGHTIACSIHQPRQEIFNAFDSVLILSEGFQVFQESPRSCCQWFNGGLGYLYMPEEDGTVADWVISLVSVRFQNPESARHTRYMSSLEEVEKAAAAFVEHRQRDHHSTYHASSLMNSSLAGDGYQDDNRSTMASIMHSLTNLLSTQRKDIIAETAIKLDMPEGEEVATRPDTYAQNWMVQFLMLTQRAVRTQLRNPSESSLRLIVGCWIGMLSGLVYIRLPDNPTSAQPRASTIFFILMLNAMTPISYMAFYNSDKRFFEMDSANGLYRPSAYYMAAAAAGTPFVIINTCASALMAYGLAGLRADTAAIFIWMAIMSLQALVANQLFVTIIWLSPTQDTAYAIATTYLTFSLLFCGFYVAIPNMVLSVARGLSWASFSKYSFEALMQNEFHDRQWAEPCESASNAPILIGGAQPLCSTEGDSILQYLGLKLGVLEGSLSLLGFYVAFHLTSFWALLRLFKAKKP